MKLRVKGLPFQVREAVPGDIVWVERGADMPAPGRREAATIGVSEDSSSEEEEDTDGQQTFGCTKLHTGEPHTTSLYSLLFFDSLLNNPSVREEPRPQGQTRDDRQKG